MNNITIEEWKKLCIDYFRDTIVKDEHWYELAEYMLCASELGKLSEDLEKAINPDYE